MDQIFTRAALRHRLAEAGARSVWVSMNVAQASDPSGAVVTVVREGDEPFHAWMTRVLEAFAAAGRRKAAA